MAKYSREIVADVLAATDIVEVIGGAVELKPSGGGRFKGLCPFHHEKTPSFSVNRDRQMYYCFGCQKSGDALTFLCEHEGLTFVESLRKLADRAGVRLPAMTEKDDKEDYQRTRLLELGAFAARFFVDTLTNPMQGGPGRQYLKTRSLKPETVKRFGLGYVPEGWQALVDAALAAGFNEAVLLQSGLAKRGDRGGVYDFFRNRLMVPIRDVSGQVVAFGGRDLGDSPAKYINSPENPVYKKSRVLYGLFEARDAMRREKRVILVEGYFDALRCFDSGIDHVVASCGTALTPEQAKLIHRYVSEVVLVYDGDPAGVKATLKGIGILTAEGLSVRALTLPDNQDPDDFVRAQGAEAFRRLVDDALDFVTFYVRANADKLASIEGRTEVARDVFVILADITEALRRDEYLKLLSRQLGMDEWLCRGEFSKFLRGQAAERPRRETPSEAAPEPVSPADRDFVAALISNDTLLDKAKAALADVSLEPGPLAEVLHLLMEGCGTELAHRIESGAAQRLYAAAVNVDRERFAEYAEAVVREQIVRIKKNALLAEEARIMQAIRQSDESKDPDRIKQLISAKSAIRRQIESVGAA